jgi:DNA-3-methyladenine glycosylase
MVRKNKVVPISFFSRPAAKVARDLIGCVLVRENENGRIERAITETEAYEGVHDLASHSAKGRTKRTEVMFGPAGRFYVYRIYGLHWMLNIVTGSIGDAQAILIRGVEGISGPGRVASRLSIDLSLNGKVASPKSGLWLELPAIDKPKPKIKKTARIGVDYAGPVWASKKLRFLQDLS